MDHLTNYRKIDDKRIAGDIREFVHILFSMIFQQLQYNQVPESEIKSGDLRAKFGEKAEGVVKELIPIFYALTRNYMW